MDINEFEKEMQPKGKRSRLEPFKTQIFELKAKGYANWQICKFLEANGISVSQEGLRKFIKSREETTVPAPQQHAATMPGKEVSSTTMNPPPQAEKSKTSSPPIGGSTKKDREKKANQYLGGSPLDFDVDKLLNENKEQNK